MEIACPTLVICGEKDILKPPRFSRTIADTIPSAELLLIPGGGHAVVLEAAEQVNRAVLDFLATT